MLFSRLRLRQFDREIVRACTTPFVKDRNVTLSFVANPGKYRIIPMHLEPQIIYPGQFLLATELLDGTDFEKAVILLLDHDEKEGSYGIVINNHSHIPLNEVFSGLPHNDWKTEPFFLGGPVDDSKVQILQLSKSLTIEPQELLPGIYMGGRVENSLTAMEEMLFSDHSRLILGYSGWGIGQLSQ